MKFSKILLILTALLLAQCHCKDDSLSFLGEGEQLLGLDSEPSVTLLESIQKENLQIDGSSGYNSYSDKILTGKCFNTLDPKYGNDQIEMRLDSSYSRKELSTQLSVSVDIKVGFHMGSDMSGSVGIGFDFEKEFQSKENSSWHFYYVKYTRTKTINYKGSSKDRLLNDDARKHLDDSIKQQNDLFLKLCGDYRFTKVTEGLMVIVGVRLEFDSVYHKQLFGMSAKVDVSMLSVSAKVKSALQHMNLSGKMTFFAKQVGGDAQNLSTLFPDGQSDACAEAVNPNNKSKQVESNCRSFLDQVHNYLTTDLSKQMSNNSNFHVFSNEKDYLEQLDIPTNSQIDYKALHEIKRKLTNFYDVNDYYLTNLKRFQNEYFFNSKFSNGFKQTIEELVNILTKNSNYYSQQSHSEEKEFRFFLFKDCWEFEENCTLQKFNRAYELLDKNVFSRVDSVMEPYKYMYEISLLLNHCNKGFIDYPTVDVKIFPADGKYGMLHTGGSIRMQAEWEMSQNIISSWNTFSFWLKSGLSVNVYPTSKSSNEVNASCNGSRGARTQTISKVLNPFYFFSRRLN